MGKELNEDGKRTVEDRPPTPRSGDTERPTHGPRSGADDDFDNEGQGDLAQQDALTQETDDGMGEAASEQQSQ